MIMEDLAWPEVPHTTKQYELPFSLKATDIESDEEWSIPGGTEVKLTVYTNYGLLEIVGPLPVGVNKRYFRY